MTEWADEKILSYMKKKKKKTPLDIISKDLKIPFNKCLNACQRLQRKDKLYIKDFGERIIIKL